jgi:gas vesicle protein
MNILKSIGDLNEQAIMIYGLGMWFIEFYLSRSNIFTNTQYVNEVFASIALSKVDERIMETLDYNKLTFLFPEQKTGEEDNLTPEEKEQIIEGTEPQGYSVTNPLLFNFMNYLLKSNRNKDKDDFLEYLKKTEFKTVTSEVIQEMYEINPAVTESFLRFVFYARFERTFIDTEKGKFISPISDYKERVDALNKQIEQLNNGLKTKISELLDMVEEIKTELMLVAEQTARNAYVNIFMDAMRNIILGYHISAENFKFLSDTLDRFRAEQKKWEEKFEAVKILEGKDFEFLKVEEYLGIGFNDPVERNDFRLLMV